MKDEIFEIISDILEIDVEELYEEENEISDFSDDEEINDIIMTLSEEYEIYFDSVRKDTFKNFIDDIIKIIGE